MTQCTIIAAVAKNGVIGAVNRIPWKVRSDMLRFKELTTYRPLVVGHETYKSLPNILPKRAIVIYSRRERPRVIHIGVNRIFATNDLDEIIPFIRQEMPQVDTSEFMIGGGAGIYAEFEHKADRMYLTEIDCEPEGDTFFPKYDMSKWTCTRELPIEKQDRDEYASTFRIYERSLIQSL